MMISSLNSLRCCVNGIPRENHARPSTDQRQAELTPPLRLISELNWVSQRTTPASGWSELNYAASDSRARSEEHTSELQSQSNLVCRLLLEKKKNTKTITIDSKQLIHTQMLKHTY